MVSWQPLQCQHSKPQTLRSGCDDRAAVAPVGMGGGCIRHGYHEVSTLLWPPKLCHDHQAEVTMSCHLVRSGATLNAATAAHCCHCCCPRRSQALHGSSAPRYNKGGTKSGKAHSNSAMSSGYSM
jgi:hypothetical protein